MIRFKVHNTITEYNILLFYYNHIIVKQVSEVSTFKWSYIIIIIYIII